MNWRVIGLDTWHAPRNGARLATLTAEDPDDLARKIEQAAELAAG